MRGSLAGDRPQSATQKIAHLLGALVQPASNKLRQRGEADHAGERVAAEGAAVVAGHQRPDSRRVPTTADTG